MADERYGNVACRRALRVMMTFEFDAESLWLARDPANAKRPRYCRKARTREGRRPEDRGAPRREPDYGHLLRPRWTAERHTARLELSSERAMRSGTIATSMSSSPDFPDNEEDISGPAHVRVLRVS